ncbi:MAG TPA: hypothetical protein VNQ80_15370 [Parapedobacter sp.]|uniref:hypothetical protein n=1 Tax=Parapedobacter sp. TaxID=1958893 RepID=UPI002BF074A5|nr:hypothetical protein [Parapedobacter sp.]HWK58722.1 hypothetical protein [Parapedobacter sp.]
MTANGVEGKGREIVVYLDMESKEKITKEYLVNKLKWQPVDEPHILAMELKDDGVILANPSYPDIVLVEFDENKFVPMQRSTINHKPKVISDNNIEVVGDYDAFIIPILKIKK